jgi:hypothetical protein
MLRAIAIAFVAASALTIAPPVCAQTAPTSKPPAADERWNVVYPVLAWMPLFGMHATLPPAPPCEGCPPEPPDGSGTSPGLSGAWVGSVRLEFLRRLDVLADYNYAGLSASREDPYFHAKAKFNLGVILGGVRVWGPIFVEGGARYQGIDTTITVREFPSVSWSAGRWSPAIGTTYRQILRGEWRVYSHIDWSGTNNVSMTNGEARVEWRPWRYFAVTGGYGFARLTFDGDILSKPIHTTQTIHGPVVGIGIPF